MNETQYKRLTRSTSDKRIAGVCGGIGKYLNVDPVIFRILFLVGMLMAGGGFLLYLIFWIAVPEDTQF